MSSATAHVDGALLMNETNTEDAVVVLRWLTSAAGAHRLERVLDVPVTAYGGHTTRQMLAADPTSVRASLSRVLLSD